MSEVSYLNVPSMMAAIQSGDIKALGSLLHAGHSPNEPQCYQVMIGEWPRDGEAFPLELAVLENRMDMVQLLIESGADLTHNPEELLYSSLRSQDLTLFSFLVDAGVRIPAGQRDICRLFLHLVDRHGFLPCSPHCKPEVREDNEIHNDYDFFRPVIRVDREIKFQ